MPTTVTFAELVAAARKAHTEGRLGAQLPFEITEGMCKYNYHPKRPDCGCAIGVGLPTTYIEFIREQKYMICRLTVLVNPEWEQKLEIKGATEEQNYWSLLRLQMAHDDWVPKTPDADKWLQNDAEKHFLKVLAQCEELAIIV